MKKLILQDEKRCFFCPRTEGLHRHHVFEGTANRKKSEEYGCVVWLCPEHHNLSSKSVHMDKKMDMILKRYTQTVFEATFSHEQFMEVFHRSYL